MKQTWILLALAAAAAGCGARSELYGGNAGGGATGPSHLYVADLRNAEGEPGLIVQMDDFKGTNYRSLTGDGEAFSEPCGPAVDDSGTIYFADLSLAWIVSIPDISGSEIAAFGSPGTGIGQFSLPNGVALDASGRIYVVDAGAHRVVRVDDRNGNGWVTLGGPEPGAGAMAFDSPQGIAVSPSGKILVADTNNHRVVQVDDMSGAGWATWDLPPVTEGTTSPFGVAYDREERLYVVDFDQSKLHRIDSIDGGGHVEFYAGQLKQLSHVTVDENGRIYLTLLNGLETILAMDDMGGTNMSLYTPTASGAEKFKGPCGIAVK